MREERKKSGCIKCGHTEAEITEIATTGTGLSKLFDIQHNHFKVVSCKRCGYSELYRKDSSLNILDLFFGG
ncbi:zinc ribbon domain-containing protein [Desulforamulus ruminis]|uniref:zinc ribbon domain-containing protein n=1 Tax=Desulforamulus ruminis TaxID=1564 RepID=UPI002FD949CD